MKPGWILVAVIILWYLAKEAVKEKPNWNKAMVSALFWPFSIFFR